MKANVIVADPPWSFSDKLTMNNVKRGSQSQYSVLTDQNIINLNVQNICHDDCVLALWTPGSKLNAGIECCSAWGFHVTQTWIWVKTKQSPLKDLQKSVSKLAHDQQAVSEAICSFDLNNTLNFRMGRCFRQTHELALIATRGKYIKMLKNKSQRSVFVGPMTKHSAKPEALQDKLDVMFTGRKVELFARRDRPGYVCCGLECPSTINEDVVDSLKRLENML